MPRLYFDHDQEDENPAPLPPVSHVLSRRMQRKNIQKEYTAHRSGYGAAPRLQAILSKNRRVRAAAGQRKTVGIILVALLLVLALLTNGLSSCAALAQGSTGMVAVSTYPSTDQAMLGAEEAYCAMEDQLQAYLDSYEDTHDYDEYHYDLEDIDHDPYVLVSYLTAWFGGEWTLEQAQSVLETVFENQYTLTETVETEVRYRTETRTETREVTDPVTGETVWEEYETEVQVPYDYFICTVKLENFNLSHLPVYTMSESQMNLYAVYMSTLGNRPDLFPSSDYVTKYINGNYTQYTVAPEALEDEVFAAMLAEAEKYLGYPYVWGGSSPSTSFDCSGYVSWVINHSGWSYGRLGATALYSICTPVSTADAKPGDLVFFVGTYATTGMSHVGIYVGDGWMIHCGDPIQYANLNTTYWQSHLYGYGRLPAPTGG